MSQQSTQKPYLTEKHQADLQSSGLSPEQMAIAGHFSVDKARAKGLVGYNLPGLIFSYCDPEGKPYRCSDNRLFYRLKPDWGKLKTEDKPKYLTPKDVGCRPYFSRLYSDWKKALRSTKIDLWETEGEKKGDCGCANGLAVIAFSGVEGWVDRCPRPNEGVFEGSRCLPELAVVTWAQRKVYQCYDSDIIEKEGVQCALAKRANALQSLKAKPYLVILPNEIDGAKNGLDDFVVRHGVEALKALAQSAEATPVVQQKGNSKDEAVVSLKLKEPKLHYKALMAWSVLKEHWAFYPGLGWYQWQGTHWNLRSDVELEAEVICFMDAQHWKDCGSGSLTSLIRQLKSRLLVKPEAWNPFGQLGFTNGTLNTETGEFVANHHQTDYLTRVRPYAFDRSAQCPTWLRFINEAMAKDWESIDLIRAMFRYAALPRPRDRKAEIEKSFDFFGRKNTGKGTVMDVLIGLVGEENIGSAGVETFKTPQGLGQLIDKDLAVDSDASGFLDDIGNFNKVVSNEPVQVKKLYQDLTTSRLGVVVVRAYNAVIGVPDGSEGLDRRLIVIPFEHSPKSPDHQLSEKLRAELPGIFAWCYGMSASDMKRRLLSAGTIQAIAEGCIERFETNNTEFRFLVEVFPNGRSSIKAGDLYRSYRGWCQDNGHQAKSTVKFAAAIQALSCQRSSGKINGCYYYTIPDMANFDIPSHLGIVKGQLEDSCRDSLDPLPEPDRDSCRQLDDKSSEMLNPTQLTLEPIQEDKNSTQPSTTVPILLTEPDTTVSQLSGTVSTVSIQPSQDVSPMEAADWIPNLDERVEVLHCNVWEAGKVTQVPIKHHDPRKQCLGWKVKLDLGLETYAWQVNHLRPLNNGSLPASDATRKIG
jgi:P4 family phage/plasmid primase-like protien